MASSSERILTSLSRSKATVNSSGEHPAGKLRVELILRRPGLNAIDYVW